MTTNQSTLEGNLQKKLTTFADKRKESASKWHFVATGSSIATFIVVMGLFLIHPSTELSSNSIDDKLQFGLPIAIASAIIPMIVYTIARNVNIQKQNDELASLVLEIEEIRSEILSKY